MIGKIICIEMIGEFDYVLNGWCPVSVPNRGGWRPEAGCRNCLQRIINSRGRAAVPPVGGRT
jgi:hypothetical protein